MELTYDDLVEDQKIGVDKLRKFIKSPERVFVLSGKAGTGKTTMLRVAFANWIKSDLDKIEYKKSDERKEYNIIGVAMAHKAKQNLNEKGGIPYVNTFASTYGHKETYNELTGQRRFVPDKNKIKYADCKKNFRVFIIDEVSMFNKKMLDLVMKHTSLYAKIVFIGDRGQLPPIIGEDEIDKGQDSPVWDLVLPDFCKHELTKRVRQTEGNPIIDMSDIVYKEIFADNPEPMKVLDFFKKDRILSDGTGYMNLEEPDVYQMFKSASSDYLDTKIIAYTNRTVNAYNSYMRNYIHDNPESQFIPNEIIYMNDTYYGKDTDGREYAFYNSSEYIIRDVKESEIDGIRVLYSELEDLKWMPIVYGGPGHQNHNKYLDVLKEYSDQRDWQQFWAFKGKFGNFSYGYTLTAYKAQGSTYKNVFICLGDIMGLKRLSNKRKLQTLYTAITRASHNVYFLNPV